MRLLPALVIGLSLLTAGAQAEDLPACPAKAAILTLAETVLADRQKLPRLKARGVGAEAAYLKIRYGGLAMDEAAVLARGLSDAGVREAVDLAGAIDATRGGFDAVPKDAGDPAQLGAQISTLRAILQHGDGKKLLAMIAALPPERQARISQPIVPAILDWPDEQKAALAASAGRHGLFFLQAGLVAMQRDRNAWSTFVAGFAQPEKLRDMTQVWSWAPALVGNPALPRVPVLNAASEAMRRDIHIVSIVAAREPERDFLMTYLNQSGDIAATVKASQALLAKIDTGRIKPEGTLDAAWLVAYRALRATSENADAVDQQLASIPFYGVRAQRPAGDVSVRDMIDRLIAIEALTPFVKGDAAAVPDMPSDLSAKFQAEWPLWLELAGALKTAPPATFGKDASKAPVIAELLLAAGEPARLADFVLATEPVEIRLALATDLAMRLDRTCASVLHHPAEAMLLAGQPIFKFDPAQ
ncbi:hypothetical protein GR138_17195 [Shinella kummerowiae]|uniref:Uncharacterized protein n=1 Tax=Shinella kummerowiae TaxID=417745 RepID=A0A6N8SJ73_9HYPH|nr:hypothetical protein [Shinella kummerowiae]MXN46932.1 hypothetical protein [Shinella kummerowiae]